MIVQEVPGHFCNGLIKEHGNKADFDVIVIACDGRESAEDKGRGVKVEVGEVEGVL